MSLNVFPVAISSSSGSTANAITCSTAGVLYSALGSFDAGVYTVTCASSTIAKVEFYSGVETLITTAVTASGTVAINLASAADRIRLWTDTGSNIVVTITKTANSLSNIFSGTLDTITTSTTYTATSTSGYAYVVIIGGGGGGAGGQGAGSGIGGGGGGGGATAEKLIQLTGSMPIVIGAGGTAGTLYNNGGTGGTSTFAGLTSNGGIGGTSSGYGGSGGIATGGTYNTQGGTGTNNPGGGGAGSGAGPGTRTYTFVEATSGGGGGGGGYYGGGYAGSAGKVFILRF